MGGQVADALEQIHVTNISDLKPLSAADLITRIGVTPRMAERLVACGLGHDESQVVNKGPPKSIQVTYNTYLCFVVFIQS